MLQEKQEALNRQFQQKCHFQICQYNEIKRFLINMAFHDRGQKSICVDILLNIMEEMRKDRKIQMTIKDKNVDAYILLLQENIPPVSERTAFMKQVLEEKSSYRHRMILQVAQIQFRYTMHMLRILYGGKATMLLGDAFSNKVDKLKKKIQEEEKTELNSLLGISNAKAKDKSHQKGNMPGDDQNNDAKNDKKKDAEMVDPQLNEVSKYID